MLEPDAAGLTRLCPACGRRVPRRVTACRCGTPLPEGREAPAVSSSSTDFAAGFRSALGVVAALVTIVLGAYWFNRPAPASSPAPSPVATAVQRVQRPALEQPAPLPALGTPQGRATPLLTPSVPPELPARAAPQPSTGSSIEDVVDQVMSAVVLVETSSGRGSGFYVRPDTILTNVHVVGHNSSVTIRRFDGSTVPARVESQSTAFDIAILKVSNPAPTQVLIALGSSNNLRVGQEVLAIGSALGTLRNTVTRGIVSAIRQSGHATLVQTDAAVNPGNSGGPLLNRSGAAIGITTMGYTDRQGLNFAVAIEHARDLLEGRPTSRPTTMSSTDDDLKDLSPVIQSDTDRMRGDGQRAYEQTLASLARAADTFDGEWRRYRELCYAGSVVGSYDREWFALLSRNALPGSGSPRCGTYLTDIQREAGDFRDAMLRADELARQAGVFPGVRRDARRRLRLESEAWDR